MEGGIYLAGKEFTGKDKVVTKMTREGLTEENLADGSVKDISQMCIRDSSCQEESLPSCLIYHFVP